MLCRQGSVRHNSDGNHEAFEDRPGAHNDSLWPLEQTAVCLQLRRVM